MGKLDGHGKVETEFVQRAREDPVATDIASRLFGRFSMSYDGIRIRREMVAQRMVTVNAQGSGKLGPSRRLRERGQIMVRGGNNASVRSEPQVMNLKPLSLKLDPQNPRLSLEERSSPENKLLNIMIERFKLEELAESIIASGYLNIDPLIGWQSEDGEVTILEGNRRLAAMKLLLNPELAGSIHRERWENLSGRLPAQHRKTITRIDVTVYPDRDAPDLMAYVGFRHVTGVLQWPALEKAIFIAQLIRGGWDYERIAEALGSYSKHVERHYVAYQVVRQAQKEGIDTGNLRESFGVLLRALQASGVSEFLGVTYPGVPKKSRAPVPSDRLPDLKLFIELTFGTKERSRIIRDSRQLTRWGRILESPTAVAYLRRAEHPDFDRAYLRSGGQEESVVEALGAAADRLEESVALVPFHKANNEVQEYISRCAAFLSQILAHFPKIRKEHATSLQDEH